MKKIALVMDGWKRFFTYAWPSGILQRIKESDEEINLYIFSSSGDWSLDTDYNIGEYNIYRLPDFNDFDGIIVDLNNIRYPEVVGELAQQVRMTGKPAVSISNELPDFYYVGIDNYSAMTNVISHLYEAHGCRSFWFIMGPRENYENSVRVKALIDFLDGHGISYSDDDFYFDSYEFSCGYKGFMHMLERLGDGGKLPDAVICANDNIAVGVLEAAGEKGYKAPRDFCVTGFDNFDKASYYNPKISTVGHIREDVGYLCADLLIRIWKGEKVERFNYTESTYIYWDSCGCKGSADVDQIGHSKGQIMYDIETTSFEEQVLALDYELLNCKSIKDISMCVVNCLPALKCDAMYLVLDDHINDYKKEFDFYNNGIIDDSRFCVKGYPDKMLVEFAYDAKRGFVEEKRTITSLFPMFDYDKGGTDFLFMPIHFRNHTVGYFVMRNAIYLMEKQYLFKVLNVLTSAMENLHEKERLEYMNKKLADMSVKDSMTGLYNRMGYQQIACKLFEDKKNKGENLMIMFVDMDRLKYINDNFGHEYGDYAIRAIASAILRNCPKNSLPVRTGGDEFVIISDVLSGGEYEELVGRLRGDIEAAARDKHFPFELSFSIGAVATDMTTEKTLDEYISMADEIMYAEKQKKKANRTE